MPIRSLALLLPLLVGCLPPTAGPMSTRARSDETAPADPDATPADPQQGLEHAVLLLNESDRGRTGAGLRSETRESIERARLALPHLLARAGSYSPTDRREAWRGLRAIGALGDRPWLIAKGLEDPAPVVRAQAVLALDSLTRHVKARERIGLRARLESDLWRVFEHDDPDVRGMAAIALWRLDRSDERIERRISESVRDAGPHVSHAAVAVLVRGGANDGHALSALIHAFGHEDLTLAQTARRAVVQLGVAAIGPLCDAIRAKPALSDRRFDRRDRAYQRRRSVAIRVIAELAPAAARSDAGLDALRRAARDREWWVQFSTLEAIQDLGARARALLPDLRAMAQTAAPGIAPALARAIRALE